MAYGLQAFKEDGSSLFDTEKICYGLIKSGYLQLVDRWGRYYRRSANLDPMEESSYGYMNLKDPISAITVTDTYSPIVFLVGDGKPCGESLSGNVRTLYFQGCNPNTKAFVFDLMRDMGERSGMNIYNESSTLTFTSAMPPLNIVATIDAPALAPVISPGSLTRFVPYDGAANEISGQQWSSSDFAQVKGVIFVPVVSGELACCLTFSRACILQEGRDVPGSIGFARLTAEEGCGGTNNGIRFFFSPAPSTIDQQFSNSYTAWSDIPTDRQPQALVIRATDYPFPFR